MKFQELKNNYRPLPDAMMAEEAEVIALNRFLSYKYGNKLSDQLRAEYEQEEVQRKEEEARILHEKIQQLKARLEKEGISPYEYMLLLEEENRQREKDKIALSVMTKEVNNLNEQIQNLEANVANLTEETKTLQQTVLEQQNKRELEWALDKEKREFKAQCEAEYKEYETQCMATAKELEASLKEQETALSQRIAAFEEEKTENEQARILAQAQLHGLRQQCGLITSEDDFTSKERFLELEAEFRAFEELFEKQWKYTKKRIRKEILGKKPSKTTKTEKDLDNDEEKEE